MRVFFVGQTASDGIQVLDELGAPADPGTTPTCTVTLPDGVTTLAATVVRSDVGKFDASWPTTGDGVYLAVWSATGANSAEFPFRQYVVVLPATSTPVADASDLATYLGDPNIDSTRAALVVLLAQQLCESLVSPLPIGASAVVLDVAARAYSNPRNVDAAATGPFSDTFGAVSGGLWLTRQNKATLRRLAGGGGAFNIDLMPASAGQNLAWWDTGNPPGDFDQITAV